MQTYAIIQLAGKQFKVSEGDTLVTDRLEQDVDSVLDVNDVVLLVVDDKAQVGTPILSGVTVSLKVVEHSKGDKIRVAKYKSKSRYRRVRGHRQHLTTLKVEKISG
jgi:large subunit ribosomal protein L21